MLKRALDEQGIDVHNIWNISEKGFLLGKELKADTICVRAW